MFDQSKDECDTLPDGDEDWLERDEDSSEEEEFSDRMLVEIMRDNNESNYYGFLQSISRDNAHSCASRTGQMFNKLTMPMLTGQASMLVSVAAHTKRVDVKAQSHSSIKTQDCGFVLIAYKFEI